MRAEDMPSILCVLLLLFLFFLFLILTPFLECPTTPFPPPSPPLSSISKTLLPPFLPSPCLTTMAEQAKREESDESVNRRRKCAERSKERPSDTRGEVADFALKKHVRVMTSRPGPNTTCPAGHSPSLTPFFLLSRLRNKTENTHNYRYSNRLS